MKHSRVEKQTLLEDAKVTERVVLEKGESVSMSLLVRFAMHCPSTTMTRIHYLAGPQ